MSSYHVADVTAGLEQAMKMLKPAMKGMPGRHRYMRQYRALSRQVATLIMLIDDGEVYFNPDGKFNKVQKIAETQRKLTSVS